MKAVIEKKSRLAKVETAPAVAEAAAPAVAEAAAPAVAEAAAPAVVEASAVVDVMAIVAEERTRTAAFSKSGRLTERETDWRKAIVSRVGCGQNEARRLMRKYQADNRSTKSLAIGMTPDGRMYEKRETWLGKTDEKQAAAHAEMQEKRKAIDATFKESYTARRLAITSAAVKHLTL